MKRLAALFARGCWDVLRVVACWLVVFLAILGACVVSDAAWPAMLPEVHTLTAPVAVKRGPSHETALGMSDRQRWERCQAALSILDSVCPEASAFVRDRYESGHLLFEDADKGRYAAWVVVPRVLIINVAGLEEDDAALACTMAHEYRHSLQPMLCNYRALLSSLFGRDRKHELVEAEAYEFEARVQRAIRGVR